MNIKKIDSTNIENYFNNELIINDTLKQIVKDFITFGIKINFTEQTKYTYNNIHNELTKQINELSNNKILLSVIYQIDVSKTEIENTCNEYKNYTFTQCIAHQIIVRELKKVLTRYYFKSIK